MPKMVEITNDDFNHFPKSDVIENLAEAEC